MLLFLLLLLSYLKIARKTTEPQVGQYAPIVITVQVRILGRFSQIHNSKTNKRKQKCTILREGSFDFMCVTGEAEGNREMEGRHNINFMTAVS